MSQEKTLDNTQTIMKDIKEIEKGQNTTAKLDNTTNTSTPKKSSPSPSPSPQKSKSKKTSSGTDGSGTSVAPSSTTASLENIQSVLADPAIKKDFLGNVTELLCGYQRKKPTDKEVKSLENIIEDGLLSKVFHVKKTLA